MGMACIDLVFGAGSIKTGVETPIKALHPRYEALEGWVPVNHFEKYPISLK